MQGGSFVGGGSPMTVKSAQKTTFVKPPLRIQDIGTMSKKLGIRTIGGKVAKHNSMQDKFPMLSRRRSHPVKKVSMMKLVSLDMDILSTLVITVGTLRVGRKVGTVGVSAASSRMSLLMTMVDVMNLSKTGQGSYS